MLKSGEEQQAIKNCCQMKIYVSFDVIGSPVSRDRSRHYRRLHLANGPIHFFSQNLSTASVQKDLRRFFYILQCFWLGLGWG